jgi:hypothetical protein
MPEPHFPGGFKNGINLAVLPEAQKKHYFFPIKAFFLMRLF